MKIVFSIFFILFIKLCGYSQSHTFNVANPFWLYPINSRVVEIGNNYYCLGTYSNGNSRMQLLKYNKLGQIIQILNYGDTVSQYQTTGLLKSSNNTLFISLFRSQYVIFDQYSAPVVLEVDTNFLIVKEKIYPLKLNGYIFTPIEINNNFYMTGGTAYYYNWDTLPIQPNTDPDNNVLFWKMDTAFNDLIYKSFGTVWLDNGNRIIEAFDKTLIIGGLSFGFAPVNITGEDRIDWYLANLDSTGNVLETYIFGNPLLFDVDGITGLSKAKKDSSYYISGQHGSYYDQHGWICTDAHIVKLDKFFNLIWEKNYGQTKPGQSVNDIVSTSDNMQVLLTQHVTDSIITDLNMYSRVFKFKSDGKVLWSRKYFQGDTTLLVRGRAWDIDETSDKGFILCGSVYDTTNLYPPMQAWLVKTDSLGCDGLRSCNDTALVCQILQASDTVCKNDTTWLHVKFKGRSAPYFVYANTTLALDSVYYPYTLPLWIDTLVPYIPTTTGMQQVIIKIKDPWGWNQSDTVQMFVKNCSAGNIEETWYPKKIEIFPNPTTSELNIKIRTNITTPVSITIFDLQGKIIKIISLKQSLSVINVSDLTQGIYEIKIVSDNFTFNERFVKL